MDFFLKFLILAFKAKTQLKKSSFTVFSLLSVLLLTSNYSNAQGTSCLTATPITVNGACASGTITDTTQDLPNIGGSCAATFNREGWYTFNVAGGPLNITITGIGNNRNIYLQLISTTGSCAGLTQINCANTTTTNGTQTETISTSLATGTYYIKVANVGSNGNLTLTSLCVTSSVPCTTPASQASSFSLGTITSTAIPASFSGTADGYLVIRSLTNTPPSQPVNGTTYSAANIATLGAGLTFVQSSSSTSIAGTGLAGNTQYYYFIYAYNNTSCSGGPLYNALGPLTGNGITCPAVPNAVTTSGITINGANLNWTAPTGGSASAITYTVQVTTDAGYTTNISGSPFTIVAPTTTLNLTGLNSSTTYYYRILAKNSCSSAYVTGSFTTLTVAPANNLCSNATSLPCTTSNLAGTTVGTSSIVNNSGCSLADYGVWYTFTGDGNQTTISVTTTSFDIEMAISSGSCASQTNISCQDSALSSGTETYTFTTTVGVNYYVYVAYWLTGGTSTGTFTISRTCTTPFNPCASIPTIASCGTATSATITSGIGAYNTSSCGFSTPGNEQLYTFTPTITGNYAIQQTSSFSSIDYQFKPVSSGCNATGWTCISALTGSSLSTFFTLTAGTPYYLLLDPESSSGGSVNFTLNCPIVAPTNDDCSGAITLTANSTCSYSTYTNSGATASSGVPAPGCANYAGGDVWFSVVVPSNGTINVDTQTGIMTDGGMALYSGTCGSLTLLACDDDSSANGLMPYLTQTGLTPGQTVYIRMWEYGNDNNGTFGICVTSPIPPSNDNCIGATTLTVNPTITCTINTNGTTLGSTQSQVGCTGTADDDVWFQFTATDASHTITVTPTTLSNAVFQVFSGTCSGLTSMTCINNTTGTAVETTTLTGLTIGTTYTIRVYSNANGSGQGTFSICITTPCTPGNGNGLSSMACPTNVAGGLGLSGADPNPILNCNASTCTTLEANYIQLGQTTTYTAQSIPYNPPYQYGCLQNSVSINIDDVWSSSIALPFNFCYYGNTYSSCLIGSNGTITFDQTSNTPGGYSTWSFSNNLPSTSLFLNTIFGAYHDIDPSVGGEVGYELVTMPSGCRALVASWSDIPMFSSTCNSLLYTGMIVLYENTNIIEVYMKEKRVCASWNSGNAVVGLQNANGTQAVVAPNRNSLDPDWTTFNEAWRFVPSGTSITSITWYQGAGTTGPVVGNTSTITVCPSATTTYTAKVTYTFCNGTTLDITDPTTITISNRKTWNGTVDTDWNKANNWTPVGIPNGSDCVIIPITANNPIISGSGYNGLAGTLSVLNGATLTVNSNNNITVTDWVTVEPTGTFLINNTASLIQINSTTNTGNITYKRNASIRNLDYVYWSSPVANFNVSNIAAPLVLGPIYRWNTTVANPNGGQGNWESATGNTMTAGKGYIARGPSSFSATVPSTLNGIFTGVPNNGIITFPISRGTDTNTAYHTGTNGTEINNYSDNWNLVGNPYPSAIRGSQFLFDNNTKIEGNIKLWTHGTLPSQIASPFYNTFTYNYSPGDYLTYNFTGTSCCPAANADLFIGAAQGFFVQMKDGPAASDVVTFNNNLRSYTYDNSSFYRFSNLNATNTTFNVNTIERNRIWLDLINTNNQSDRTLFGYIEGATMGRDSFFDSNTLNTGSMSIYSLTSNTDKYLIQGRELPFDVNDEVPIGIHIQTAGSYSIAIAGVDGLFNSQNIYLRDKLLDITYDIKAAPYRFYTSAGTINERFKIVYLNNVLAASNHSFDTSVRVYAKEFITINSTLEPIDSVTVFDILGRKLGHYTNVESNEFTITNLEKNNTALLIQVKLKNGITITQKVIF